MVNRKKITNGLCNQDKQAVYNDRMKPLLPKFDQADTSSNTLKDSNFSLNFTLSQYNLSQRRDWINLTSSEIDKVAYDENKKSFTKQLHLTSNKSRKNATGNFSSSQSSQFLLPALDSTLNDKLTTFKQKFANTTTLPFSNSIARTLNAFETGKLGGKQYSEEELMHRLNLTLKGDLRQHDLNVDEAERLRLVELQKIIEIRELQKFDKEAETTLDLSRKFLNSIEVDNEWHGAFQKPTSQFLDINHPSLEVRSMTASATIKPSKSMASIKPQKSRDWLDNDPSILDDAEDSSKLTLNAKNHVNTLLYKINPDKIPFAGSRIHSLQLLEQRATAIEESCNQTKTQLYRKLTKSATTSDLENCSVTSTVDSLNLNSNNNMANNNARLFTSLASNQNSQEDLNQYESVNNDFKSVASSKLPYRPLSYTLNRDITRTDSIVMKQAPKFEKTRSISKSESLNNYNRSEYNDDDDNYDSDYDPTYDQPAYEPPPTAAANTLKNGKKLLPQSTQVPHLTRNGLGYSKANPDYATMARVYATGHSFSSDNLESGADNQFGGSSIIFKPAALVKGDSKVQLGSSSSASSISDTSDAMTDYYKRKILRDGKYARTQATLKGFEEARAVSDLKAEVIKSST